MAKRFNTAKDVEEAFYTAFESKNIEAMQEIWLDADHVECIHPMGSRLLGYAEVLESWQKILGGSNQLLFEREQLNSTQSCDLSVHVLHEKITTGKQPYQSTTVITTNVYQQTDEGWYMVLHHASLSPQMQEGQKEQPLVH